MTSHFPDDVHIRTVTMYRFAETKAEFLHHAKIFFVCVTLC